MILLFLFYISQSFASITTEQLTQHYHLTQKDGLIFSNELYTTEPTYIKSMIESTVRFGNCSGTFISNQGHVLTALHCLESIQKNKASISWGESGFISLSSPYSVMDHFANSVSDMLRFDFSLAHWSIHQNPNLDIRILFKGKAFPISFPTTPLTSAELLKGKKLIQDFAIIQIDPSSLHRPWTCAVISKQQLNHEMDGYAAGYPNSWQRADMDVNFIPAVSEGKVYPQGTPVNNEKTNLQQWLADSSVYVSTAPVARGMSGGGLFNEQGQLIGVNSMGENSGSNLSRINYHFSIAFILKTLREQKQQFLIDQAFHCGI